MKLYRIILLFVFIFNYINAFSGYTDIKNNKNLKLVKDLSLFDSSIIKNKLYLLNYIDPDERSLNENFMDKIEELKPNIGSIAIINLKASWLPDFILETLLQENQKKHPKTIFVYDYNKELVKLWNLKDNSFVVMLFDKNKNILFYKEGKLNIKEQNIFLKILRDAL